MSISLIGLASSSLSILTFQNAKARDVGCGIYIYSSSIVCLLTTVLFLLKYWVLVLSFMNFITNRFYLEFNCRSIDFLLRICLIINDWLTACVAIERILTVKKGPHFNKSQSKQAAKYVLVFIFFLTISTSIQDPIHRQLIDDVEEQRIWCITKYSAFYQMFNSITIIFHISIPFLINILSAICIIILLARQQAKTRQQISYKQHLRKQFREHKHLLLSTWTLTILAIPRFIISLFSGCMKSVRNPWLFLTGYFISFIPSTLIFIIFVLPSPTYKKIYKDTIQNIRRRYICF